MDKISCIVPYGITCPDRLNIAAGAEIIEDFHSCPAQFIHMPESVTTVEAHALANMHNLTEIQFSPGLSVLGSGAFMRCSRLNKIDLSRTQLTAIPDNAFMDCTGLKEIYLPQTIQHIGHQAFDGCRNLTLVHLPKQVRIGTAEEDLRIQYY